MSRAAQATSSRWRAAFKLLEIDDKVRLLKPGAGWSTSAPGRATGPGVSCWNASRPAAGSWRSTCASLAMDPVSGAIVLQGDFQDAAAEQAVLAALAGQADLVLSDMAPNTTGHNATDHLRIMALAELALDFAVRVLAPGGGFVTKVFQGGAEKALLEQLKLRFAVVRHIKPPASRKDSSELYVVATGFRPAAPGDAPGDAPVGRPRTPRRRDRHDAAASPLARHRVGRRV